MGQRAIGLDVVGVGFSGSNVGDVERFAIGRANDAIGLLQVLNDAPEFLSAGRRIIDAFVLLLWSAFPIRALVIRVRKVKPSARPQPHVIRAIEEFALIIFDHDRYVGGGADTPELVFLVSTSPKVAFRIK